MAKKLKPGPAPKPESERRRNQPRPLFIKLTPAERGLLDEWAASLQRPISTLARELLLRAAKRSK